MATDFYVRLSYEEYKELENQLRNWESIETSHQTVKGFYHKALRIKVGTALFEFQGPLVMKPILDTTPQRFEDICRATVSQDSHCVFRLGHIGPCRDNMGYTATDIYPSPKRIS